jgi:SAM-dependent methyltransferase
MAPTPPPIFDQGDKMPAFARARDKVVAIAKSGVERYLWARVRVQVEWDRARHHRRPLPSRVPSTDILTTADDFQRAIAECRRLGLPLHHDRPKNWDALGAVSLILHEIGTDARVLDAGAASYSPVLPWLYVYGARELVGNNLEFKKKRRHGSVVYEPGDITDMPYADGSFDAITCLSVIEHGVPVRAFISQASRILRPGGLLIISTDYDKDPPDTSGLTAYGSPVKILGPPDIRALEATAGEYGLVLSGSLQLDHSERPLHWKRTNLDFTFIRLAFVRQ